MKRWLPAAVIGAAGLTLFLGLRHGAGKRRSSSCMADQSCFKRLLGTRKPVMPQPVPPVALPAVASAFEKHARGKALSHGELISLFACFEEADSNDCFSFWKDLDGDSKAELVLKRYWIGSGIGFDFVVLTMSGGSASYYLFYGGERGITFYESGAKDGFLEQQVVDLDGDGRCEIIIPCCLSDRGVDAIVNWPTIYWLREGSYTVADGEFGEFYRRKVLPRFESLRCEDKVQRGEVEAIRVLVSQMSK